MTPTREALRLIDLDPWRNDSARLAIRRLRLPVALCLVGFVAVSVMLWRLI